MKLDSRLGSPPNYEGYSAAAVLCQIHTLLARAFRLSSKARTSNEILDALLVIRNDVEVITKIIDRNKHFFRHPRVHLLQLCGSTFEDNRITSGISSVGKTVVNIESTHPVVKIKLEPSNEVTYQD